MSQRQYPSVVINYKLRGCCSAKPVDRHEDKTGFAAGTRLG